MKIHELDFKNGKKYVDSEEEKIWTVSTGDLYDKENTDIAEYYILESILKMDFEEVPAEMKYEKEVIKENNYGKCPFCGSRHSAASYESDNRLVDKKKCLVCKEEYTLIMQPVIYEIKRGW